MIKSPGIEMFEGYGLIQPEFFQHPVDRLPLAAIPDIVKLGVKFMMFTHCESMAVTTGKLMGLQNLDLLTAIGHQGSEDQCG